MPYPLPAIGSKGCYTLLAPFDTLISPKRIYTCQAVRSLHDWVIDGKDPFKQIYEPVGLTEQTFNNDLKNGVSIVTLIGDGGETLYIPNSYIQSYPIYDGVKYVGRALSVPLGILPEDVDISTLKSMIVQLVHDVLGIDITVTDVITSGSVNVSQADHNAIVTLRNNNKTLNKSYRMQYLEATALVSKLQSQMQLLECYIKNHCCGRTCNDVQDLQQFSYNPCELSENDPGDPVYMFMNRFEKDCQGQQPQSSPPRPITISVDVDDMYRLAHGGCLHGDPELMFFTFADE